VIPRLRKRNEKVVLYDAKDGEFVAKFLDEETDVIFNQFDARSVTWNVFEIIDNEADYDAVAASVVPKGTGQEQFFRNAARDTLAGILRYCALHGGRSNRAVWESLCKPVPELHKMLVSISSNAASTIESHDSGQTQGVIATLHQFAKIFRYMAEDDNQKSFSLKQWVRDPEQKGFIFLTSNTKQRETLKGIYTLFIDSLANEILSLRDDPERRIFIIADEFGSLHPLNSIKDLLALGRSKGCSFWIGVQEKAQIDALYGKDMANTITNQCNVFLIYRMNDTDSSEYFCKMFGEQEIETMETSFSSAIRDHRDSESYRNMKLTERLVLPSEIQSLPNLNFYLKISGYPLTRSGISYRHYPDIAPAFVPNERFTVTPTPEPAKDSHATSATKDLLDELDL
jgi:type IV secretory pathway TraG/TraD family ATPase VirD4